MPPCPDHQGRHPRIAPHIGPLDEDQTLPTRSGGSIKLSLRWEDSLGIHCPVLATEETDIDRGLFGLLQIRLIRTPARGRQILEQEDLEELPQQVSKLRTVLANARRIGFERETTIEAGFVPPEPVEIFPSLVFPADSLLWRKPELP